MQVCSKLLFGATIVLIAYAKANEKHQRNLRENNDVRERQLVNGSDIICNGCPVCFGDCSSCCGCPECGSGPCPQPGCK